MANHLHTAAGIDLGSNTFRLLIANCSADNLKVLDKKTATVRLGHGLKERHLLHESSLQKGFEVLRIFRQSLDLYQPQSIRVCGTEALRQARNNNVFLQKAEDILLHKIDIINGDEEARLSLAGVLSGYNEFLSTSLLLVDVGGGSTELLSADTASGIIRSVSTPLGVVSLTEKFLAPPHHDIAKMDALLTDTIGKALDKLKLLQSHKTVTIIGCGGSATSMAALDLNLTSYNESLVHGHQLHQFAMEKSWKRLLKLPVEKRNSLPCLGEGRGEILPAGIRIYQILQHLLHLDSMQVSDTGLLEGILLSSLGKPSELQSFPLSFIRKR